MHKPQSYRRDRSQYNPDYRPGKNARLILEVLERYPYARSTFIGELLGICKNTRNYHLNLLFNNRYIYKPEGQGNGYNSLNDAHIYANEKRARDYLAESFDDATNFSREKLDMPHAQFRHMMMVCDMLQSIEIGMKDSGCTFITQSEIIRRTTVPDPMKLPAQIVWAGKAYDTYGRPDAIFGIKYPNGKTRLFFVEAEHKGANTRKTKTLSSTQKKILVYQNVHKTGAVKQLKKHGFTVLFGFPTKARVKHIKALIEEELGQSELFLLSYVPTHERLYKSPLPLPELFTGTWQRGGLEPISIKVVE